jgi:hypothetical protein
VRELENLETGGCSIYVDREAGALKENETKCSHLGMTGSEMEQT